jgi:steroid 5-alpha reductase family enzyme
MHVLLSVAALLCTSWLAGPLAGASPVAAASPWPVLAAVAAAGLVLYLALWGATVLAHRMTVIDPWWGLAFVAMAAAGGVVASAWPPRSWLVVGLLTVWAVRFATHVRVRPWGRDEADNYYPYAEARRRGGARFWWTSLFTIALAQYAGHVVVGAPVWWVIAHPVQAPLGGLDGLAAAIAAVGIAIEATADRQLVAYKRDAARAPVLDRGLWRWSRHPNYFGDALFWWGVGLFALALPGGWVTLCGPAVMTALLWAGTGVPLMEARSRVGRRPEYAAYVARTSAFIPWPPRAARSDRE